jgi:hypothetical protein
MRTPLLLLFAVALAVPGCAYPRRTTSLTLARDANEGSQPDGLWQVMFVGAVIPPRRRGDLEWDGDGLPDAFVRVYRGDALVWEGPAAENTLEPQWNATLPENVWLPRDQELRIELWDDDGVDADPIGIWRGDGLPATALPDADARVRLEGDATVIFRVSAPRAHRGLGVRRYEVRGDSLLVLEVIERSPAGRAGLREGDRILSIGGEAVGDLGEARAASALSMSADRHTSLSVEREDGSRVQIDPDGTLVWLSI